MKKIFVLVAAIVAMSFAACGNKEAEEVATEEMDTVAVEETIAADSLAVVDSTLEVVDTLVCE